MRAGDSRVIVTGAAGFIGFHLCARLLASGHRVVGFDNLNPYYDPALKRARLAELSKHDRWSFVQGDLTDAAAVRDLCHSGDGGPVVHLAAQAGVRWSLERPSAYVESNLVGFANILEACRAAGTSHLVYASSSSVYGMNRKVPFDVGDGVSHPASLYAATKRSNELMAHVYAHLFGIPCTGLRFFTVYGPWGRPDMAYWSFTESILKGRPITVYGGGRLMRDFTYVDDVVESVSRLLAAPPVPSADWDPGRPDPATSSAPWRLYNIGNSSPVVVNEFIRILEELCGRSAIRVDEPRPAADVDRTFADVEPLARDFGFRPSTSLRDGLARFIGWFRTWHGL
jgi:UDP-glucuronate 4-epimerase